MAETPRFAHLMILLLMGAEVSVALCTAAALFSAVARRKMPALFAAAGALGIAAGYAAVLVAVGGMSGEVTLAPGRWKYFCEADCHLAYSIESAQRLEETAVASASLPGSRLVVRLKTWFDENSIARFRGNGPLEPEPRRVALMDSAGHSYAPLPAPPQADGAPSTPMTQALRPGESYSTRLVFAVPREARGLRLLVTDTDPASRYIIDHENSPMHGKILLRVPEPDEAALSQLR